MSRGGLVDRAMDGRSEARARHIPGEAGLWVFILGDMLMFGVFFGVFLYSRADDPELFAASQGTLNQAFGAINTILLLTSSLLVVLGVHAVRRRVTRLAPALFTGAFACGLGFAAVKVVEYGEKLNADLTPSTNDFYTYYFVFTGIHFLHLIIGTIMLVFLWRIARKAAHTDNDRLVLEAGASYWHMVDLLWIVLFPLLYLSST